MELHPEGRMSWDQYFMQMADLTSQMSTCLRKQTGALIVKDRRVISTGFNGSLPGAVHCNDHWKCEWETRGVHTTFHAYLNSEEFDEAHREWSLRNEVHGEANAIIQARVCEDSTLYSKFSPCYDCTKLIIASRISRVVYSEPYVRDHESSVEILMNSGVRVDNVPIL